MDIDDELRLPPALADRTGDLLRRVFARAQQSAARHLPPGRHGRDMGLLITIDAAGPLSQRRLGEILHVNRSVMVKLADSLEEEGLLRRERDPADRRNYALSTTAQGKAALAELSESAVRGDADLTEALTKAERTRLSALLRRMVPDLPPALPDKLTRLTGFLVPRAYLRIREQSEAALGAVGIAAKDVGTMAELAHIEPCPQQRLADALGVSGPAVVARVAELEKRGLIERRRNPEDRREHLLSLTTQGRTRLAEAIAALDRVQAEVTQQVGAEDVAELNRLLAKIAA